MSDRNLDGAFAAAPFRLKVVNGTAALRELKANRELKHEANTSVNTTALTAAATSAADGSVCWLGQDQIKTGNRTNLKETIRGGKGKEEGSAESSRQTDRENYYSVIRAPPSRTDKDRSRFPASHTSICHFAMQRIHAHTRQGVEGEWVGCGGAHPRKNR